MMAINTGFGGDEINISVFHAVSELWFVDAGPAATNPPNGDVLTVLNKSGKPKIPNFPAVQRRRAK